MIAASIIILAYWLFGTHFAEEAFYRTSKPTWRDAGQYALTVLLWPSLLGSVVGRWARKYIEEMDAEDARDDAAGDEVQP